MFENWAADVLANYLGKFVDVQRDRLRISLWGGEGTLENVQLRVDAFDYLQLPFVIREGSIGRLKLQIPWGRWRGGALVVELSDVVLCVSSREETDWEEGPALRRAQAAKQAQLAAAELAKLGSRVAATGRGNRTHQQADYAAATAAGAAATSAGAGAAAGPGLGSSWGWAIVDYVTSFLLNRLQFDVKNVHVYFEAAGGNASEYEAFGVQLGSLTTVVPGNVSELLAAFAGLKPADPALAAKVVRQLHVQGWSCYWKPKRQQQLQEHQQSHAAATSRPGGRATAAGPALHPTDYILAPVEAVLEVAVHSRSSSSAGTARDSSSGAGLACDVFIGAPEVALQLSSQQLTGMGRLADDAAVWAKRNKYGRYRPPGWITAMQAMRKHSSRYCYWSSPANSSTAATAAVSSAQMQPGQQWLNQTLAQTSQQSQQHPEPSPASSRSSRGGYKQYTVVPTGRCGVGAPVTWLQVWQYAVRATIADLRDRTRQQQGRTLRRSEVRVRRKYVHLYQQKLDALQEAAPSNAESDSSSLQAPVYNSPAAAADAAAKPAVVSGNITASEAIPAAAEAVAPRSKGTAGASCRAGGKTAVSAGGKTTVSASDLAAELATLEQELEVEDILLCRSLAEVALDRRTGGSSEAERYRSWFAWGTSGIASFLYPTAAGVSGKPAGKASSGGGASMPTEAEMDELLTLLHDSNADGLSAGVSAAAAAAAAAAGGTAGAEAAAAGTAAAAPVSIQAEATKPAAPPAVSLNWQLLRLTAVLQDCPTANQRKELLMLDIEGTGIRAASKHDKLSAQLQVQDFRLFDCCSDPGVRECVLQRVAQESPVVAASGVKPKQGWGKAGAGPEFTQGVRLQQQSPDAYGWGSLSMPAVTSAGSKAASSRKSYAAAVSGSSSAASAPAAEQALLSVGFETAGSIKQVSVYLEPLQLLARPGIVVGLHSMLQQLPQDTLQHHLQAAAAAIRTAKEATAACSRAQQQARHQQQRLAVQLPAELRQVQLHVRVQEILVLVPTELNYALGLNAVLHLQGLKLSPVKTPPLLEPQGVAHAESSEPDHHDHGTDHSASDSEEFEQSSEDSSLEGSLEGSHSSDSSSTGTEPDTESDTSSGNSSPAYTCVSATTAAVANAVAPGRSNSMHLLQQQYSLQFESLAVVVQQPTAAAENSSAHQQQQTQELLKLPAVQGSLTLTFAAGAATTAMAPAPGEPAPQSAKHRLSRSSDAGPSIASAPTWPKQQRQHHLPLVRLSVQLPPLSSTVTSTMVHGLQQFAFVLKFQLKLPLPDLVACYRLSFNQQTAWAADRRQQQQEQELRISSSAAAGEGAAVVQPDIIVPPSPTVSEVERWMAAPAHTHAAAAAQVGRDSQQDRPVQPFAAQLHGQPAGGASSTSINDGQPAQGQLQRCDSDQLLQSMSPPGLEPGMQLLEEQQQQRQERTSQTSQQQQQPRVEVAAVPVLTGSDVQLFVCSLLLEELDVQYTDDASSFKQQNQQTQHAQGSSDPSMHLRLQASMLRVLFRHGTHSSRAEVSVSDLVLQDVSAAPRSDRSQQPWLGAAPASWPKAGLPCPAAPNLKRLLNHVLLDQVQVVWRRQLREAGVLQETHVSLAGLQLQGHPGDVGLFLLPARSEAITSVSVDISSSTSYRCTEAAAPATQVSVQLHNFALGLDGILKIVAAIDGAKAHHASQGPRHTPGQRSASQPSAQPTPQPATSGKPTASESSLALQIQLLQCQLLSCSLGNSSDSTAAGTDWGDLQRNASVDVNAWAADGARGPAAAGQQKVTCDLLLDLPLVSISVTPPPSAGAAPQGADPGHARSRPMVLVQDVGLYLPVASGSDLLLPVLSIPYIAFRQQQQLQETSGILLKQSLHIPALGASVRPSQIEHAVQLVQRQQQQWQDWTALVPKRPKQRKPKQQRQLDSSFSAAIDDLQLLLLAAPGTSDKGLLVDWQQLQLELQQYHSKEPSQVDSQSATPEQGQPELDAKVLWHQLAVSAVQQHESSTGRAGDWLQEATEADGVEIVGAGAGAAIAAQPGVRVAGGEEVGGGHGAVLRAGQLPAVSWLRCSGGSTSRANQQTGPTQTGTNGITTMSSSAFATAAASAAAAAAGHRANALASADGGPGAMLERHATLSRFLSAKGSWRSMDLGGSMASVTEGFFSPQNSSAFLSAASSLETSSSTNWGSALGSISGRSGFSRPGSMLERLAGHSSSFVVGSATAGQPTATSAANAVPLTSKGSIIAASWQLDPQGSSLLAGGAVAGSSPTVRTAGMSGLFGHSVQANLQRSQYESALAGDAAAAMSVGSRESQAQPGLEHHQQPDVATSSAVAPQQLNNSPSLPALSKPSLAGRSPVFSSFSYRHKGHSPPDLHRASFSSQGAGHRNSNSKQASGTSPISQGLAQSLGGHWLDADDEFFSVAGESLTDDLSVSGDESGGMSPAAQARHLADGHAAVHCELLPMPGFGPHGCDAAARWLLLSLTAGLIDGTGAAASITDAAAARTAVHLTVAQQQEAAGHHGLDLVYVPVAAPAAAAEAAAEIVSSTLDSLQHRQQQQQHNEAVKKVGIAISGWQLQVNARCWDLVAAPIMQAVHAATAPAVPASSTPHRQHNMVVYAPDSTQQHEIAPVSSMSIGVTLQQLQLMLFIPPNDAPASAAMQPNHPPGVKHGSNKDFGPWQDPGNSTSPTAVAAASGGRSSRTSPFSTPFQSPAKDTQDHDDLANSQHVAEVFEVTVEASAVLSDAVDGHRVAFQQHQQKQKRQLQLKEAAVPELSVRLGAVGWDATTARPASVGLDVQQVQQQPHHLMLLLLKDAQLSSAARQVPVTTQQQVPASHSVSAHPVSVTRLLDDSIAVTAMPPAAVSAFAAAAATHSAPVTKQAYEANVGSISGWVSTIRLSLLMHLQQQLLQQWPAVTAAAAMAGPAGHRPAAVAVPAGPAELSRLFSSRDADAYLQSAASVSVPADADVITYSYSGGPAVAQRRPEPKQPAGQGLSCRLGVGKIAVLISTDEPEPWLLQQSSQGSHRTAAQSSANLSPTLTACTTPLVEVAILPLTVDVDVGSGSPCGHSKAPAGSAAAELSVNVSGAVRADVFSVDKLGWEPVLDPWQLQASLAVAPVSSTPGSIPKQAVKAAVTSSNLLDLTVAPSSIVALRQLQVLSADAASWQADSSRLQQLLASLSNPSAGAALVSGGRGCWMVNQLGVPLQYAVADARKGPAAAAALALAASSPGSSPVVAATGSGMHGRVPHQVPVPLQVTDSASAGYYGRHVVSTYSASSDTEGFGDSQAAAAAKHSQVLYLQPGGQQGVIGPVALEQLGYSLHSVSLPGSVGAGAVSRWPGAGGSRCSRQQQLVVEVSRHRYGGRLISLHSTVQLVNNSNVELQLGWNTAAGPGVEPAPMDVLGPGGSMWLPLQVLQTAGPSLCFRPAGLAATYSWSKALNIWSMIPTAASTAASGSAAAHAAAASADDTGFWYYPSKTKAGTQYLSFQPLDQQQQGRRASAELQRSTSISSSTTSGTAPQDAPSTFGQVLLALGCCAKPWQGATSSSMSPASPSGTSNSTTGLWQLVLEAPAVFTNQLPVALEVSVLAGKDDIRGLYAIVGSRESLPLYGCEPVYLDKLCVRPEGFKSSDWVPLHVGPKPAVGQSHTALPALQQTSQELELHVAGARSDQPGQTLKLRTSRSSLTGSLSISVSCSLWLFNCLGFQVAVKQPADDRPAAAADGPSHNRTAVSPVHRWAASRSVMPDGPGGASSMPAAVPADSNPVLWLTPYPWLSSSASIAGSATTSQQEQQNERASNSSRAAAALARSASTPALGGLGLGALATPEPPCVTSARTDITDGASQRRQLHGSSSLVPGLHFSPARVDFDPQLAGLLSPIGHRQRSHLGLSGQQHTPSMASASGSPDFLQHQQRQARLEQAAGTPPLLQQRPQSAHGTAADPDTPRSRMQKAVDAATTAVMLAAGPRRAGRMRRHSSGLFMLASGQVPSTLTPAREGTQGTAGMSGLLVDDAISPPQLQHAQGQAGSYPAETPAEACSPHPHAAGSAASSERGPIVYPLQNPDQPGMWLPLLAAGNLQRPVSATAMPAAALLGLGVDASIQQRTAAAAAAAEQLLMDIAAQGQVQVRCAPAGEAAQLSQLGHAHRAAAAVSVHDTAGWTNASGRAKSPPPAGLLCLARAASSGLSSGPRLSAFATDAMSPPASAHTSGPDVGLAGLTRQTAAAGRTLDAKRQSTGVLSQYAESDSVASAPASAAFSPSFSLAVPALCGWSCQAGPSGSGNASASHGSTASQHPNSSVQLQLCAAPAALASAAGSRGSLQLPTSWSVPAAVELREGCSGPASILKLPLALPSSQPSHSRASLGGLESVAAVDGNRRMRTSASSGTLASVESEASSTAATQRSHRSSSSWGRWGQGSPGVSQQGVCFVSVHTAPVPDGGGAWAVHLLPTYLLVNTLQCEVQLRQYGSDIVLQTVPPGGHCCILWPDDKLALKLQFRVAEPGWSWSGAAAVEAPGELLVKIRHRNRGETLLLQLDVAAASSGSSMVATLSARQGGFAPYRIDNCSCEVIHLQQVGCVEQEDVLQPYSSLPFAWDEPSLPHRVLLFLPGRRLLGEIPLEQVGQSRRVSVPVSGTNRKRSLLLTTTAEGPTRVLWVLDISKHLQQPAGAIQPGYAHGSSPRGAALSHRGVATGSVVTSALSSHGSQQSLPHMSRTSSSAQLQHLSRSSSTTSSTSKAQLSGGYTQQKGASSSTSITSMQAGLAGVARTFADRNSVLRRLGVFLGLPLQQLPQQGQDVLPGCDSSVISISQPSIDLQIQLQGLGVSLVSDSRELLYMCARDVTARVCQDAVRCAVGLCVSSIRVENTLYGCQYPILLVSPVSRSVFGVVVPQAAAAGSSSSGSSSATPSQASVAQEQQQQQLEGAAAEHTGEQLTEAAHDGSSDALADVTLQQQSEPASAHNIAGPVSAGSFQHQHSVLLPHHLALGVLATVWRSQPSGVVCVEQLGVHVSPLALSLEGKHIKQLVDFATALAAAAADSAAATRSWGSMRDGKQQQQLAVVKPPGLPAAKQSHVKLYVEEAKISPITLCVSFAPDSWFDPLPAVASNVTRSPGNSVTSDLSHLGPVVTPADDTPKVADGISRTSGTSSVSAAAEGIGTASSTQAEIAEAQHAAEEAAAAVAELYGTTASSSSNSAAAKQLPIWLQMALALAHAEEGAWLTLAPFESSHTCINTDALGQVLGRHYILAAYKELPKVLASLDIFGDPARLLQALGLGFWHLLTLPAHSARWGPYRSLQRLLRGVRVMAYGISSSIAKGSKRSKAALLPLVPAGLTWHQQHQQPSGQQQNQQQTGLMFPDAGGRGSTVVRSDSAAAAFGSLMRVSDGDSVLTAGSSFSAGGAGASSSSSSSAEGAGGQDLLHVLVAGYSLTLQQMLRSFQAGQPFKGLLTAAAQALVLPALLLLEISESTASSFRRLLIEQVAGAVPVRVPRYVTAGQLLKPYDRLESLGRALLHHTPGPFVHEEFLGCIELELGLYAVVTVGHLIVIGCSTKSAAAGRAPGIVGAHMDNTNHHQQQQAVHVQYKHPELLMVLGVKDVMMVAVEGSAVRLLCMAGDQAGAAGTAAGTGISSTGTGTAAVVAGAAGGSGQDEGSAVEAVATATADNEEAGVASSGLRELVASTGPQDDASQPAGSTEYSAAGPAGSAGVRQSHSPAASAGPAAFPVATAPGTAEVSAAAAAVDAAVAAADSSSPVLEQHWMQMGFAAEGFVGGKWFVGHVVPCGSQQAAQQLHRLLQKACSRLDVLIARSVWQRQVML